jgi:hypothetical protein
MPSPWGPASVPRNPTLAASLLLVEEKNEGTLKARQRRGWSSRTPGGKAVIWKGVRGSLELWGQSRVVRGPRDAVFGTEPESVLQNRRAIGIRGPGTPGLQAKWRGSE